MIVAGDEGDGGRHIFADLRCERSIAGDQPAQQQRGCGGVAVVNLVAHVQSLRDQRLQLDAADFREGCIECAVQRGRHPRQAIDDLGAHWRRSAAPSRALHSRLLKDCWPFAGSRTIHTGIDGLMMPAIGPTAP